MKRTIQISAILIAVAALTIWAAAGAHRGWTQTLVPVKTVDAVTGIEGIDYRRQFIPGVDFLGLALIASATLFGASLFIRKPSTK
jgi:hypothetical protein